MEIWIHRILLILLTLWCFSLMDKISILSKQSEKYHNILSKLKIIKVDKETYNKMYDRKD